VPLITPGPSSRSSGRCCSGRGSPQFFFRLNAVDRVTAPGSLYLDLNQAFQRMRPLRESLRFLLRVDLSARRTPSSTARPLLRRSATRRSPG